MLNYGNNNEIVYKTKARDLNNWNKQVYFPTDPTPMNLNLLAKETKYSALQLYICLCALSI